MRPIGFTTAIRAAARGVLFAGLSAGMLTGCATVPSKAFRVQAAQLPFKTLLQDPGAYRGQSVILGGYVIETINEQDKTLLVVLQAPLDVQNKPKSQDLSEGRFLIQTREFLDPEIFTKDRKITVGGTVLGTLPRELGKTTYGYPLIESLEIHLWAKEVRYPGPYHPYHHPYWPRPWYPYDPYYPWWW